MTYSLGITGVPAEQRFGVASHKVSDSVAEVGAQAGAMQRGTPFLAKGPGGEEAFYTYDAERSIPGVIRILKRLY